MESTLFGRYNVEGKKSFQMHKKDFLAGVGADSGVGKTNPHRGRGWGLNSWPWQFSGAGAGAGRGGKSGAGAR